MISLKDFWYDCSDVDLARLVFAHVNLLDGELQDYRTHLLECARGYSGRDELGYDWFQTHRTASVADDLMKYNVTRQVIDTCASITARSGVRLRAQTRGGDYDQILQAQQLEELLYGDYVFHNESAKMVRARHDSFIYGLGTARLRIVDDMVTLERALARDIVVDERACSLDGRPLELFHRTLVNKEVLKAYYPKAAEAIDASGSSEWAGRSNSVPDGYLVLIEGWRLPIGKRPGKYVCSIEKAVLHSSKYEYHQFPFVFMNWQEPQTGFFGTGIVTQLSKLQSRIDEVDQLIVECQRAVAFPMGFVDTESKMYKDQATNEVGRIYVTPGGPPVFVTPTAVNAEMYQHREQLVSDCFRDVGLSQMSANAVKPPDIESRAALRELDDIQNTRFIHEIRKFERAHCDLGWRRLELSRDLYMHGSHDGLPGEIDWSEVSERKNRYTLTVAPASIMSETPAGRMDMVRELSGVVQMDPGEIRFLLGHPDLENSASLNTADYEHVLRVIGLLSRGEYEAPDALANPELHLRHVTAAYTRAKNKGASEAVLSNFRDYLAQIASEFGPTPPTPTTAAEAAAGANQSLAPPIGTPPDVAAGLM